jgi:hypothetical protein
VVIAGFGEAVKEALRKGVDFLVEHGSAQTRLAATKKCDLLTALRQHDLP